jgi:FkbM family methyltransferase
MLRKNYNPRMTRRLIEQGMFRSNNLVVMDAGARGGYNRIWNFFGDQFRVVGFEPDAAECARINAENGGGRHVFYPVALDQARGRRAMNLTRFAAGCGFYDNTPLFSRVQNGDNVIVTGQAEVATEAFDNIVDAESIENVDFVKLDAEGAELDILQGCERLLQRGAVLGVEFECRFQKAPEDAPVFGEIDAFLRSRGFTLFDLDTHHFSRRQLPLPMAWDYRDDEGNPVPGPTTDGQVITGDALYFRDLGREPPPQGPMDRKDVERVLKLAAMFEIHSLGDCAAELLLQNRTALSEHVDVDALLDGLPPAFYAGRGGYRNYLRFSEIFASKEKRLFAKNLAEFLSAESAQQTKAASDQSAVPDSGMLRQEIHDLQERVARMSSERQELKAGIEDLKQSREFRLGRRILRLFGAANRE